MRSHSFWLMGVFLCGNVAVLCQPQWRRIDRVVAMDMGLVRKAMAFRVKYRRSQKKYTADSIGCAPTKPRRDIPAARHCSQLGRANHDHWLQRQRGRPRMGSAWKKCPSSSAPHPLTSSSHTRITTSGNATTSSRKNASAL